MIIGLRTKKPERKQTSGYKLSQTYVFNPNVEVSQVLAALGVLFELRDALFQEGVNVGVFPSLGKVLLCPCYVLVPQLKGVGTVVGPKFHFIFPGLRE